jgi:hypothetical protein
MRKAICHASAAMAIGAALAASAPGPALAGTPATVSPPPQPGLCAQVGDSRFFAVTCSGFAPPHRTFAAAVRCTDGRTYIGPRHLVNSGKWSRISCPPPTVITSRWISWNEGTRIVFGPLGDARPEDRGGQGRRMANYGDNRSWMPLKSREET